MKAIIWRNPIGKNWTVIYHRPSCQGFQAFSHKFMYPDGAFAFWLSIEKQIIKEQKAFSKLLKINERLLSLQELIFIKRLQKSKCLDITKRQYGYLTGIAERQGI